MSETGEQQATGWVPEPPPATPAGGASGGAADRPELLVAGAFAGGVLAAMILKRLAR